jgi:hypothetical protein
VTTRQNYPAVLATRRNMDAYADAHPSRPYKDGILIGRPAIAYSPTTGEQYSATSGDYFMRGMDDPLLDSEGEPMILVHTRTIYEGV